MWDEKKGSGKTPDTPLYTGKLTQYTQTLANSVVGSTMQ